MVTAVHPPAASAPRFMPAAWNNDPAINKNGSNCFQYAFAGSKPTGENNVLDESIPNPGATSGYSIPDTSFLEDPSGILNLLQADGIRVESGATLPPPKPGMYLVGVYVNPGHDYHWVRQDADGAWSEKPGVGTQVQRFLPPANDGSYQPLPQRYHNSDYQLVGYAYVPQEGINLGLERRLADRLREDTSPENYQELIRGLPGSQITAILRTLKKDYPDVAPAFEEAIDVYGRAQAEIVARWIQTDPSGRALQEKIGNIDSDKARIILEGIKETHPEFARTYADAYNQKDVNQAAVQVAAILSANPTDSLANLFTSADEEKIAAIGARLAQLAPSLVDEYEAAHDKAHSVHENRVAQAAGPAVPGV